MEKKTALEILSGLMIFALVLWIISYIARREDFTVNK